MTDESGQLFNVVIGGLSAEKIVKRDVSATVVKVNIYGEGAENVRAGLFRSVYIYC